MNSQLRVTAGLALFASVASAASGGYGGYSGGGYGGGSGRPGTGSGSPFNGEFGNFQNGAGFDVDAAVRARNIHGILGALAMVVLFPLGSIFMRVIPGRFAIWVHAAAQMIAYIVYIAAVGLGIYLVKLVQFPFDGGNLLTNPSTSYHPIIGLVVLVFLFFQPFLGVAHHIKYKQVGGRQIWSYLHLFNGRIFITLGIANGGLGLWLAGASKQLKTAYIVVAVIMWVLWMLSAVWGEWRRGRAAKATPVVPAETKPY